MKETEGSGQKKQGNTRCSLSCMLYSKLFISSRGQALVEYVVIMGLLMATLGILTVFFVTFKEYGGRVIALVSSEYP